MQSSNHHILTVSELNAEVNLLLLQSFPFIWLEGEISNLAHPASGHLYFLLKDAKAQVRCVMFRNYVMRIRLQPENGKKVLVRARISVYEERGEYQLIIEHMEDTGEGALQREYKQLKQKLATKGWFNDDHKQNFPMHPKHIGIISSPNGAAIQDILNILKRRCPHIPITVYPVAVQGEQSVLQLIQAIRQASTEQRCDVLIITRGGGSVEDLWSFNNEHVAKAIYECSVPIISGIGHEIDFTIADFVDDKRAPTPSAAAELISPNKEDLIQTLDYLNLRLYRQIQQIIAKKQQQFNYISTRLQQVKFDRRLKQQHQSLNNIQQHLQYIIHHQLKEVCYQLDKQINRLKQHSPKQQLHDCTDQLEQLYKHLLQQQKQEIMEKQQKLRLLVTKLNTMNPLATLERGYSIIQDIETGKVIHSSKLVEKGQKIKIQLIDSMILSEVI